MFRAIFPLVAAITAVGFGACSGRDAQVIVVATPTGVPPSAQVVIVATATPLPPTATSTIRPTPTIDAAAIVREANFQATYTAIVTARTAMQAVWVDEYDMYAGGFQGGSKSVSDAYNHMQTVSCQAPSLTSSGAVLYGAAGDLWPTAYKTALDKAQFGCYILQQFTNDRTTDRWAATSYALTQNVTELNAALKVIQANSDAQLRRAIQERQ